MPTHQAPADTLQPSAAPADSAITTLYRAALGPMATERYLSRFVHFDHLGRTRPGWNTAASLFTLSWMALRYLWGPALMYVAAAEGLALLVFGVGRAQLQWPDAVHWGLIAVFGLLAFLLPGLFGDAILHTEIRKRIARALAATRTIPEACTLLERQAGSFRRLYALVGINLLLLTAAIAAYVVVPAEDDSDRRATDTASPAIIAMAPASETAPALASASAAQATNDGDASAVPGPPAASDEAAPAAPPAAVAWAPSSEASSAVAPPQPASSATTSPRAVALPSSAGSASPSKQRPPPRQAKSPATAAPQPLPWPAQPWPWWAARPATTSTSGFSPKNPMPAKPRHGCSTRACRHSARRWRPPRAPASGYAWAHTPLPRKHVRRPPAYEACSSKRSSSSSNPKGAGKVTAPVCRIPTI